MATAASLSYDVKSHGVATTVPDDDVARLMYYLNCVTVGVGIDILADDLIQYQNYHRLTPARIAGVVKCAVELSPDEFIGKLIFRDDEGDVCGTSSNKFVTISAACNIVSLQRDVLIAGKIQGGATKVMFFKTVWLQRYYFQPLENIAKMLLSKHCGHCEGNVGMCACRSCPRTGQSRCTQSIALIASRPTYTPATNVSALKSNQHQCNCDGCGKRYFDGARYRCTVCSDYDLCQACYSRDVHDTTHAFNKIEKPGASPRLQQPRRSPPRVEPKKSSIFSFGRSSVSSTAGSTSSVSFRKDDVVTLTGLTRADMNGRKATVLSVDHGSKKAQIRVIGMDSTFKVKFENITTGPVEDEAEELY